MQNGPFDQNPQQQPGGFAPGPMTEMPGGMLDDEEGGLDVRRYLNAVLRQKWLILALAVAGLALGAIGSRFVEPEYEAFATLQIPPSARSLAADPLSPIQAPQAVQSPAAWLDLLRSFQVMDEVVRRRRLYVRTLEPAYSRFFEEFEIAEDFSPGLYTLQVGADGQRVKLAIRAGATLDDRAVGDSLGLAVGFRWAPVGLPAGAKIDFDLVSPRDVAVRLAKEVQAPTLRPDDTFLTISLRGADPVATAATVNAVAERFVEVSGTLVMNRRSQSSDLLRAQLDRAQGDLEAADADLQSFRINNLTVAGDGGSSALSAGQQTFLRMRGERDSLAFERDAIERAIRGSSDSTGSLLILFGSIPSARASSELTASLDLLGRKRVDAREMRLTFGPAHEPLRRLDREIEELETRTIPVQARALAEQLGRRIQDLDSRLAASTREMQSIPARVSEEQRLQRRVVVASTMYAQLQAAYDQAQLAQMGGGQPLRILDGASVPTIPVSDQIRMIILGGLAGGLGLGLLIAILMDRFDKRIRYPEQVTKDLGLTILGSLPMMRTKRGQVDPDYAAQLLESMRGIRMNLSYAHGTAGTFVTTITSPGPGDGKSFTSANLARAFSASGRRTILVDADTRRGLQHRTFGIDRRPGLIDLLDGSASRDEVIRRLPDWGIDFIPCGTRKSGGPELLASPTMQQLVLGLRSEYQAIIIDSPPLGAGVDPLVLASLAGTMVVVLRTGYTDRDLAGTRLTELGRLPIRLLGAILNDVRQEGHYKYYGYLPGYRAEDEVDDEPRVHTPPGPATTKRLSRGG